MRSQERMGWAFMRGQCCPRVLGEDHGTKWRSSRTVPERKRGEPSSPCQADAPGPGARKLGHDCRGSGYATHTSRLCGSGQGGKALLHQRPPKAPPPPPHRRGAAQQGPSGESTYPRGRGDAVDQAAQSAAAAAPWPEAAKGGPGTPPPPAPAKRACAQPHSEARHGHAWTDVT